MDSVTQTEKGHGRVETRSAYTTDDVEWQAGGHGRLLNALERCIHDLRHRCTGCLMFILTRINAGEYTAESEHAP